MKYSEKQVLFCCLFLSFFVEAFSNPLFGKKELINDGWYFMKDTSAVFPKANNEWQAIQLPHDWSVKGVLSPDLASCTGYLPGGIGWYKKDLLIPDSLSGKKLYVYFEGVYNRSEVYINGHLLGKRPNGYISFLYELTSYLKYGEQNTIAVRVDHSRSADSRWYTGSGIYRDVYLVEANPLHIEPWGVYVHPKSATTKSGELAVQVQLKNEDNQKKDVVLVNELVSPDGTLVKSSKKKVTLGKDETKTIETVLQINKPELWSLSSPRLYTLTTYVQSTCSKMLDSVQVKTGFRSFKFDPDKGFSLNGEWTKVKGVCVHHDAGVLGTAVPRNVWKRRLQTLKEVGCNAIRTSHNPQSPDLYDLCDELGLLVLNEAYDEWEFPKRKWVKGWNVGAPAFDGSFDFFETWGEQDMADFVKRDRNHLSVFAWSIGNEVDYPNDPYSHPVLDSVMKQGFTQASFGGYKKEAPNAMRLGNIAKRLVKVVKQYDPSRPVTAGLAGVTMSNQTEYPGTLDITGYNYTESRYELDHETYPKRVIFGSENRHDMDVWKAVRENEHIFGQFVWTGIDYLGESGSWPSRGFYSGMLDFGGNIKPRGYYRRSLWSDSPVAYLGAYPAPGYGNTTDLKKDVWMEMESANSMRSTNEPPSMDAWAAWNYEEGQMIRVVCYTNSPFAYLTLNGKKVGDKKGYDDSTGIIYWDIPYESGTLEVVTVDDAGKELVRNTIRSSGAPYSIKMEYADKKVSKGEVAQIKIQVVDESGIPVVLADNEIACDVIGKGRLLGLEASNNADMGDYTDSKQRVFNGQLWAYVQASDHGTIKIRFSSQWLKSCAIDIEVE